MNKFNCVVQLTGPKTPINIMFHFDASDQDEAMRIMYAFQSFFSVNLNNKTNEAEKPRSFIDVIAESVTDVENKYKRTISYALADIITVIPLVQATNPPKTDNEKVLN